MSPKQTDELRPRPTAPFGERQAELQHAGEVLHSRIPYNLEAGHAQNAQPAQF